MARRRMQSLSARPAALFAAGLAGCQLTNSVTITHFWEMHTQLWKGDSNDIPENITLALSK